MKKIVPYIILLFSASLYAVNPAYVKHDYIKGSTLIMTNIVEYVDSVVQGDTSELEVKIAEVALASTNYADSVASNVSFYATNYTDSVVGRLKVDNASAVVSETAADRGVTFINQGEDENTAVSIGKEAKAGISNDAIDEAPDNTKLRSVAIAIGGGADATTHDNPYRSQGIAIGWKAQAIANNAIAIGSGAQHTNETTVTGNATVADAQCAIAMGYDAKGNRLNAIAIGRSAKAQADNAIQLGTGVNTNPNTVQFLSYQILNSKGQIPYDRLKDATQEALLAVSSMVERTAKPGNMTVDCTVGEEQKIEPMVDGLSELLFVYSNGVWRAGAECEVVPPLGGRNYNILIQEIPQAVSYTNGVPYYLNPEDNFILTIDDALMGHNVTMRADASVGYTSGINSIVLTNAPCIVKVREPSTNRVIIVAKPWTETDI